MSAGEATYTLDSDYRITRVQVGPSASPGGTLDRSLSWTGETVDQIIDNQNPGISPPFTYNAQTQSFSYTPTRRLAASGFYGSLAWAYDGVGNRLSETKNGMQSSYLYPLGSNRLASVTSADGTARGFTYDAAGNVLTDARDGALGMSFEYDVEGRLSRADQTNAPSNGGAYRYDAFGRLASRTVTQSTAPLTTATLYVHDLDNHIIAETDATGATLREYIWLNDLPVAVVDKVNSSTPQIYFVHTDHLGRPARMTNPDQSWAWDVIYSPFGEASYIWANPATMDIRFPGQWFQLESGLAYNWHRHYDATLGRYLQPDPLGLPALLSDGANVFVYVGQNPVAYVDPSGLQEILFGRLPPVIESLIRGGAKIPSSELELPREVIPRLSGKEGATDVPDWCRGEKPTIQESGKDFAKRLMDEKYGPGNYEKGPTSEFNRIQKWGDRNFRIPDWFLNKYGT